MKTEAVLLFETLVTIYQNIQRYNPADQNMNP